MSRSVDQLLADARARLVRVDADGAARILSRGGLVVDLRPLEERRREGEIRAPSPSAATSWSGVWTRQACTGSTR